MLSYRAKRINRFTSVNLWLPGIGMARESLFLSSSGFNKFTHSNRQVTVQLPFRGDVS